MAVRLRACIVGAGFSGLGAAIALRRSGISDFLILERADRVGGTWRDNIYPGCACDVQSRLYELSSVPWPAWTRRFAGQPEIQQYLESVVEIFGLEPHLRMNTELLQATWSEDRGCWQLQTSTGDVDCDSLILGTGGLVEPLIPDVPGAETFSGAVMHTARWDPEVDLAGRRVAVVGTGASAIQVVPAIAPEASRVVLLQRTPPWIMPRRDRAIPRWYRELLGAVPPLHRAVRSAAARTRDLQLLSFTRQGPFRAMGERVARRHLASQVPDAALRKRLTPDYAMGCKRVLLSDDYYPALCRSNVEVVPALAEITPHAVVDADGVEHPVDVLIWATGFAVMDSPIAPRIIGAEGISLGDVWSAEGIAAYRGTVVAGFPNLYLLMGPHTGLGHSSVVLMSEAQIGYTVQAVAADEILDVEPSRQEDFERWLDERMATTVWQTGGCDSWYQDGSGRNVALWPGSTRSFARLMRRFDRESYRASTRRRVHASA